MATIPAEFSSSPEARITYLERSNTILSTKNAELQAANKSKDLELASKDILLDSTTRLLSSANERLITTDQRLNHTTRERDLYESKLKALTLVLAAPEYRAREAGARAQEAEENVTVLEAEVILADTRTRAMCAVATILMPEVE